MRGVASRRVLGGLFGLLGCGLACAVDTRNRPPAANDEADTGNATLAPGAPPRSPAGSMAASEGGQEEEVAPDVQLAPPPEEPSGFEAEGGADAGVAPPGPTPGACAGQCLDLRFDGLTIEPDPALVGDVLSLAFVLRNSGTAAAGPTVLEVAVGEAVTRYPVAALGPNQTQSFEHLITADRAGPLAVTVRADASQSLSESDEENNLLIVEHTVNLPLDLVARSLTASIDSPVPTNAEVTLAVVIENVGAGPAPASTVAFQAGGNILNYPVPALAPGQSLTLTRINTFSIIQNYLVTVTADSQNELRETSEDNNRAELPLLSATPPDLVIETLAQDPLVPAVNDEVTFTVVIRNAGQSTAAPSSLGFRVGGSPLQFAVPRLLPNEAYQQTRSVTFTDQLNILVTAVADEANAVAEADEDNNSVQINSRL
jgi:CARDB protein